MGRPGLTVPTWNVLDKADTAKRVNILERTTEMIRIEETEHEFLLYIPASQKERAKAIRPREWDWKRVCWVYPRNSLVYCALRAEFGNDPAAKFAIAQPKFAGEKEKGQRQTEDVTSLRNSISQLRAKVRKLSEENKRLAADSERKASRMAESLEKLNDELKLNLSNPNEVVKDVGLALTIGQTVAGITGLVASGLTSAGIAAADGIIADIGAVAGAAGSVLAVAGFGLTLYNGITALNKLNDAIDKVNDKRHKAEDAEKKMKDSLDDLLKRLGLKVGSYENLKDISNDWAKLAENFDKYSTAFYNAMTGFAAGKSESQVGDFLKARGSPTLKDDVLALAKIIEQNILQMMKDGKTDEQIINFYAKENPHDGLRFLMDSYFVSTLRTFL